MSYENCRDQNDFTAVVMKTYITLITLTTSEPGDNLARVFIFNGFNLLTSTLTRFLITTKINRTDRVTVTLKLICFNV